MPFYYYIFIAVFTAAVLVLVLFILSLMRNERDQLFMKGLRKENLGHYNEAILIYEELLLKTAKLRGRAKLRRKIANKIKVLCVLMAYENSFRGKASI